MNGLALCAGAGGLELGMRLALGARYRCVGYVERDAYAAATLVARMEDQTLDPAPIWDDLATFDGRPWRGRVDLITAGFPCQPFSQSGQQRGVDDDRWLWPDIARIVEEVAPTLAFFENVPPLVTLGLPVVLGDLARLGFDAEWSILSAATVGATQQRQRIWILAHRHGHGLKSLGWEPEHDRHAWPDPDGQSGQDLGDAKGIRGRARLRQAGQSSEAGRVSISQPRDASGDLADADGAGRERRIHGTPERRPGPPRPGCGVPLFPPGPDALDDWGGVLVSAPELEPSLCRVADGMAHRVDRLRVVGGGVVPLVAASAFLSLVRRAQGGGMKSALIDGRS